MQQHNLSLVGTITWIGLKSSPFSYRERKKLWDEQLCKTSVWHIWKKWLKMLCKRCVLVLCRGRSSLLPSFGDHRKSAGFIYTLCVDIQLHLGGESGSSDWIDLAHEKIQVTMSSFHW